MHTLRALGALALTAALVAAGVAVATGDDTPPVTTVAALAPSPLTPSAFGVFRRAATPGDAMPAAIRHQLAPAVGDADLDAARAVAASGTGAVWAIPGPDRICLAQPDPIDGFAVSCASIADTLHGRLWVGLVGLPGQAAGDARVAILVPDSVESVDAMASDGTSHALPVADNVAFAAIHDSRAIRIADATTTATIAVPGTPPALVAP